VSDGMHAAWAAAGAWVLRRIQIGKHFPFWVVLRSPLLLHPFGAGGRPAIRPTTRVGKFWARMNDTQNRKMACRLDPPRSTQASGSRPGSIACRRIRIAS